jgi:hypothetical protein
MLSARDGSLNRSLADVEAFGRDTLARRISLVFEDWLQGCNNITKLGI